MKNIELKKLIDSHIKYLEPDEYSIYIASWSHIDDSQELDLTIDLIIEGDYINVLSLNYPCETWEEMDSIFDKVILPELKKRTTYLRNKYKCSFEIHDDGVMVC